MLQQTFMYINSAEVDLRLVLEPWGDEFVIASGKQVVISVHGNGVAGSVELEQLPAGLVIYGYEGSTIEVTLDGKELEPANRG